MKRMSKTVVALILITLPTLAIGGDLSMLTFKDGSTQCGDYYAKNGTYCRSVGGAEMCYEKAEIKKAVTVQECPEPGMEGSGNSLAEHQPVYKTSKQKQEDWEADRKAHGGYKRDTVDHSVKPKETRKTEWYE